MDDKLIYASEKDLEKIRQFNSTDKEYPDNATIQELIEETVTMYPDETAVICDHDKMLGPLSMTYGQLNQKVNQLAHLLRAEGIGPDHVVGIMVERSFAMIIGILGIIKAGGAYLPLSPENPPDRTRYMLEDSGALILLVQKNTADKISFQGKTINLENPQIYQGPVQNPEIVNNPGDLAYVIYTSGSTGKPKGVMIEHHSVINRLNWMQNAYPINADDLILQKTPYYFDVSVWEIFWWALRGAKLCFLMPGGEKLPLAIVETIKKHKISVMHFVPSMLNVFLEYLDGKDSSVIASMASVRQIFASGEALTPSHVKKYNDIFGRHTGAKLINLYGPTEATVDVTYFDCPTNNNFEKIPIGKPIDNIRIYILKDNRHAAIGGTGDLCIAGVGLARGYANNPGMTRERFTDNPVNPGERIYRTGDLAKWLPDGKIEYLGREDFQVKISGLRIELGEIENTIRDYPSVSDCVAIIKKYSESIILIIAYIVCKENFEIDALKNNLKKYLPEYMIPNHFERIDQIPLTSNGKADRKSLPEPTIRSRG